MAVWARPVDHLPPQEGSNDESPFELFVRSYGPDVSLAEYLVDRILNWDAEGRPPDENRLRVRAYPLEADYSSLPNEIIIERRTTRFVIDW
jgi:hypothetical protein